MKGSTLGIFSINSFVSQVPSLSVQGFSARDYSALGYSVLGYSVLTFLVTASTAMAEDGLQDSYRQINPSSTVSSEAESLKANNFGNEFTKPEASLPSRSDLNNSNAEDRALFNSPESSGTQASLPAAESIKEQDFSHESHSTRQVQAYQVEEGTEADYQGACSNEVAALKQRLAELELSLHNNSQSRKEVYISDDEQVSILQEELNRKITREEELANQVARLINEVAVLEESLSAVNNKSAQLPSSAFYDNPRARLANTDFISNEQILNTTTPSPSYVADGYDIRSVNAARDEFHDRMLSINALISERDRLYKLNPAIEVHKLTPQLLETSSKDSYLYIKRQVANLNGSSKIQDLRRGLEQIESILLEDIDIAQRISG